MASMQDIRDILCPRLGSELLSFCSLQQNLFALLNRFDAGFDDYGTFVERLDSMIFETVHSLTKANMYVRLDNGHIVRVYVDDCSVMADKLFYLVLRDVPCTPYFFNKLHEHAMHVSSLATMRVLYEKFSSYYTAEQLEAEASTIRTCYPAALWRDWLKEKE